MKTRLLWLFLLCLGLLLLMSLMVVGEDSAQAPAPSEAVTLIAPHSAPAPPREEDAPVDTLEGAEADGLVIQVYAWRGPQPHAALPYRLYAYYAFHPSDWAG